MRCMRRSPVLCAESGGSSLDRAYKVSVAAAAGHNSDPADVWRQVRRWRQLAVVGPEQLTLPFA